MKKRILFFIETGGPGGAEQVVLQLLEGFRSLDHEVFLSTLRTGWLTETAQQRGFEYHQIPSQSGPDLALPFKIAKLIRSLKIDILHSHLLDSNFYGALGAKLTGISHLGTEHGDVHHIDKKRFLKLKLLTASSGRSKMTAVSEYSARKLISLGVRPSKVSVIPNPVKEPILIGKRAEAREALNINSDWVWVHVGNLRPVKDQATLLRGFAHSLSLSEVSQKLILVGDGSQREILTSLTHELGISDKVIFIGHSDNVDYYLSAADGFLMSSISESMPVALLEAISYSLYPICSAVGGIPELLSPDQLFNVGDFRQLGQLCANVLDNKERCKEVAEQFSKHVRSERALFSVCQKYMGVYE